MWVCLVVGGVSDICMVPVSTQRCESYSKRVPGIYRVLWKVMLKYWKLEGNVSVWYSDKLINSLSLSSTWLSSVAIPLFRNNKGASCVCEFLPWRDLRRSTELWAPQCRMKEISLKLLAEQLSSPGTLNGIWFMFNFTIFLFLAPDSWTMTRALYCLLQLEEDCFYIC